ncbi:MAG: MBL fold metallo-hydrolase [Dehalococcoidia bacterium]|nr:MBL fold metallo-hydrolase [Dehalococcoidia bacterium]
MRIECELLGTGTSYGVPTIGCHCRVCVSTDPRNKRMRSSVLLTVTPDDGVARRILVDVTPDIRTQALRANVHHLDGVILTHAHADHCHGLDDLRAFYWRNKRQPIPLYAYPECMAAVQRRFDYIFDLEYSYKGVVRFAPEIFETSPFNINGIQIVPVPLVHGPMRVAAVRVGDFAYITDTNHVPPSSIQMLRGVRLVVLDALRRTPHPTHLSLPESLAICEELGVKRVFFTHINHDMDHDEVSKDLPGYAALGYDTLRIAIDHNTITILGDRLGERP